ncbi:hypothetical protein Ciccas_005154 [Cichlidogyrus casuarinus]|uniref:Uncharacterized protein n=1 Tax=Cichlidogyrus casuarinus TaxID=1844966 RepID=A0ABD2Q9G7_9PLAT
MGSANESAKNATPQVNDEYRALFERYYRPQLNPPLRDRQKLLVPCENTNTPWCCVFCGNRPDFVKLGSLYGPYFLSEDEMTAVLQHISGDSSDRSPTPNLAQKRSVAKGGASNGFSNGNIREILSTRITLSNREFWVHLNCVLWAPGTYLRGDGVIGGILDALQLALAEVNHYYLLVTLLRNAFAATALDQLSIVVYEAVRKSFIIFVLKLLVSIFFEHRYSYSYLQSAC